MNMHLVRATLAEAIGTFILVAMGSLAIISASGGSIPPLLTVPFGFGLGLLAAIVIFGHVSGGHFNPAVTLGALFDGRVDIVGAILYWIAQVVGAVAASLMILLVLSNGNIDTGKSAVAVTMTSAGVGDAPAFAAEAILTAIFVAVILTVTRTQPTWAPLVIALTLTAIHFAAIPITGSSVNPARSLGPALVAGKIMGGTTGIWVYLAGPLLGGVIGWGLYRFFTPPADEFEIEIEDEEDLEEELEEVAEG
jgi:aquaporin Z